MYNNYNQYTEPTRIPAQTPVNFQPRVTNYSYQWGLKGRPVSSIEEARASSIDFDGSVFFFPDLANKRIYTKQINVDGTATLNVYELTVLPQEMNSVSFNNFITREEFETVISQLKGAGTSVQRSIEPVQPIAEPAARKPELKTF